MWIKRDFNIDSVAQGALPIKVLRGPRQVGKTSLLARLGTHQVIYLDDAATRLRAQEDARFFLDQLPTRIILDEAPLAPALFPELKRRVDQFRIAHQGELPDVWLTGSNQTLMHQEVGESLAGRASYFDLNTLSAHELGDLWTLRSYLLRGGWPELYASPQLESSRYLNDIVSTYIERDIVIAAGIERRAAFLKALHLLAGRVGQLFVASDIARDAGVDATTVQSWVSLLATNAVVFPLPAYFSNLNKRLTKAPKYFFYDVGLAVRLQGWTDIDPIMNSPLFGHLFENIVVGEFIRFFLNRGTRPSLYFVRSKEKVEIDLLVELGNQRYLAVEVKTTPDPWTAKQHELVDSLGLTVVEKWVVSTSPAISFKETAVVAIRDVWERLAAII
ncbi:MAG: ATP-binding protein [Pseudomonadota bacterium]|jgi:predicted AAA+ superfamily ATPase